MAWQRSTLTELIDRVSSDLSSRLGTVGSILRRSVLGVFARVVAGVAHELYGYLEYMARQANPATAEGPYLAAWAMIWGITRKPAEFAEGQVAFAGINAAVIPAGTIVQRSDGLECRTRADVTITNGSATATVDSLTAGSIGNTPAGTVVSLLQPISGVQSSVTIGGAGLTNGSDAEDDASLRSRLLARIQQPPQGGNDSDYVQWAREVPGVTRAWVSPLEMGAGTVTVRFVRDNDSSIIPDPAEVQAVQDHIELRRPVTAEVFVVAPAPKPVDMTIALNPNTSAVQQAVLAELQDLMIREAEPGGTILLSHIREVVSLAAGEYDNDVISPTGNVVMGRGEFPVLGTVIFQPIS